MTIERVMLGLAVLGVWALAGIVWLNKDRWASSGYTYAIIESAECQIEGRIDTSSRDYGQLLAPWRPADRWPFSGKISCAR